MKKGGKLAFAAAFGVPFAALTARAMYSELCYIFNLGFAAGDKTPLAGCAGLSNEENVVEEKENENARKLNKWRSKTRYAECKIHGYRDTDLYGQVFLQNEFTDNWALVVHGYGGSGDVMNYAVKEFHDRGYNVVLPDLRCHGGSGGDYIGMGCLDKYDILEWCGKIIKGNANAKIVLYGVSMGAAAVLMAAGEDMPKNIVCVVSDCSYDSVSGIAARHIHRILKVPAAPIIACLDILCSKKAGYHILGGSVVNSVKKINIPIFFIHGGSDDFVPTKTVYKLFKNAKCKKDLLVVHNAGHGVSAFEDSGLYWTRVFDFVKNAQ